MNGVSSTTASPFGLRPALAGLLGALGGALLGTALAAQLDVTSGASSAAPLHLAAFCRGLLAPLGLVVAGAVWIFRLLFLRAEAWLPWAVWRRLSDEREAVGVAWLGLAPVAALGVPLGLLAASGVAMHGLGTPSTGRAAMAMMSLSFLPFVLALLAAGRMLAAALGSRLQRRGLAPAPVVLVSLLALGAALGLLIAYGEPSGAGGPLGILGVLRRQELELRAPGLLLVVAAGALLVPSPRRLWHVFAGLPLLFWLGSGTWQAAHALSAGDALAIEREAPLSRIALSLLRRLTDRDDDGVSALFAGGDCNDGDPSISPRAIDLPDNGKDEDCSGGDAKPSAAKVASAEQVAEASAALQGLPDQLNVLLVTIDTLRADLGYLGNPRPVSPGLDALTKQSVLFERAYSLASYTGKSMGPLMIGKYSSEVEGGFSHFNRYSKNETFVQERLQAAGVHTLSVQGYWYFYKDAGFERGFDVIDSSAAPKLAAIEGDQTSNSDEQSSAAIKLLEAPELAQKRFFMWIHYVDPHADYAPHPDHDFGPKPRDRYDAEVAFVDEQLSRVLKALEQTSFGARTAVIVTSDHGEAFGEHGMIRHGFELWEELVRVPLIMKVPGVAPRRVAARRSAIDLVPTLLDLFKVPMSAHGPHDFLSGESLLADLRRAPGTPDPVRPVFIDMARGPYNAERQALIARDLKLTVSEGKVLGLYDLSQDPGEKRDISTDKARLSSARDELSALKSRLRRVPMPQP